MAKAPARLRALVLDSGALIAQERSAGRALLAAMIAAAIEEDATIVVPASAIAESWRPRAAGNRSPLAATVNAVPALDEATAYRIGELNGATCRSALAGAHVALEAMNHAPCIVLTSDPSDIAALLTHLGVTNAVGDKATKNTQVRIELC
jgi:hypothetical protein